MLIFFPLGVGGGKNARAGTDSKLAISSPQLMKGKVVMLSGKVCVVRDATGKSVRFKIDKETKIDGSVKEGQKIEISATPDGVVLSIKERP